ncbi:inositol 2-dehydrogenase [Aurantimonas aggregata]|uniref:Inositol 2-dehydrogenase n=1 Tax=Aurantimonas aggregata TaxID=2047720 RepID=A0A6L9ML46_9HYPH|nr:inositol 2-dehydrogenase [Aurantimonas aggregata]NDV88501.1 inositol 2-dehydrogenase [Aurantimonas aggregata]
MSLSIAVLGAGRIGKVHAAAIAATPGARLAAVADAMAPAAEALAAAYGCPVRTIAEIAAADDVDAVAICTPTDTHAELIELFARAGKPIFCEKPIDLSLDRVRQCLAVVAETGTPLMVGFNRRFDPHFVAVKRAIDDGRIGAVEQVVITSRDPGLPHLDYLPRSGGLFRDMTIHDFDMARHLLGEEVASVMATASVLVDPRVRELGDVDTASIILTTASGRQAVITNSRRATYGYDQRIEAHGSDGMVSAENQHEANVTIASAAGYTRPPLQNFFMDRYAAAYAAEIASFLSALTNGTPMLTTGHDGYMALALAEAASRSAAEGRRVDMPEILGD